jgi:hypothetical protein
VTAVLAVVAACGRIDYDPVPGDQGPGCPAADADTRALYLLDDSPPAVLVDAVGAHDAVTTGDALGSVPGRCGRAVRFPPLGSAGHAIADGTSPAFDLTMASIDFWLRTPDHPVDPVQTVSVLSRDSMGLLEPGHLTVYLDLDGHIIVRLQTTDPRDDAWLCTEQPLTPERWTHVGVNFGSPALELVVDGVPHASVEPRTTLTPPTAGATPAERPADCGNSLTDGRGIAGNDEPWILGASSQNTALGTADPVNGGFASGELDHLRISRVRRDFSAYAQP